MQSEHAHKTRIARYLFAALFILTLILGWLVWRDMYLDARIAQRESDVQLRINTLKVMDDDR